MNHIKGPAKLRGESIVFSVRWGEYPVLKPWFCPPTLQSPELTLSQKIKAKLQNPDLLELCHLVPKEVVELGEAWGSQDDVCFSLCEMLSSYPLGPREWELAKQTRSLGMFPLPPSLPCSKRDKDSPC